MQPSLHNRRRHPGLERLCLAAVGMVLSLLVLLAPTTRVWAALDVEGGTAPQGSWQQAPLPAKSNRMQSVHSVLLPNGKVLMVNGSSFRTQYISPDPAKGEAGRFVESIDLARAGWSDNSGLWDPASGVLKRISSPAAMVFDETVGDKGEMTANDLFCSGHLQLSNGNVLFAGGTGSYYAGGAFTGSKWLNLYDWKQNKWSVVGRMQGGRWYPSLVELANGKVLIIGGLDFNEPNQINPLLEIFDPASSQIQSIDLRTIEGSPFNTKISGDDVYDTIDLYPRIFSLADGRFLLTGDEAGIEGVLVPHRSRNTYLMTITDAADGRASVSFAAGPLRHETNRAYGTAVQVPGKEDVLLIGGIVGSNSISFGREGKIDSKRFPGVSVSRTLQRWTPDQQGGSWTSTPDFLPTPRANLQAVILPTSQLLVLNGGIYPEYQPRRDPLLLSPDGDAAGGYRIDPQPQSTLPRLYHNGALLLPDGRVLSTGGNANRATHAGEEIRVDVLGDPESFFRFPSFRNAKAEPEEFSLETFYNDPQHYFADNNTEPFVPAEIWRSEIFSPPYLAEPGQRPRITAAPDRLRYGESFRIKVAAGAGASPASGAVLVKLGSVTHSFDFGQRLAPLALEANGQGGELGFKAPENANLYPPGYYMLFCLDQRGIPSEAKMVQLAQS
jgi:hypothetical protein